ncbi:MAG: hypothetical protein J6583_04695 [Gilliamella sp.]|nr:hypothetical protein [Gilliamella sp.]MCO6555222.1 hypothetical protein [Gilliamella sp.]
MKKIPLLLTILLFSWFNTNYTFANTQTASSQYKKQFTDVADVAAFNDYIACYPVSEHLNTYKKIASHIRDTHYHFLSDANYNQLENQLKIILED